MIGTWPTVLVRVPAGLPSINQPNVAESFALYDEPRSLHYNTQQLTHALYMHLTKYMHVRILLMEKVWLPNLLSWEYWLLMMSHKKELMA